MSENWSKIQVLLVKVLLKSLIFGVCLLHLPAFSGSADNAHARVQASHAALQSAERDYRQRLARGDLSAREATDYAAYIAQLRRRFFGACTELTQISEDRVDPNTPCPSHPPRITRAVEIDQLGEQTYGERTTALAQDLDAALSDFDEMLLREQERVKAATPPPTAGTDFGAGHGGVGAIADGGASAEMAENGGRSAGDTATSGDRGKPTVAGTDPGTIAIGGGEPPRGRSGTYSGRQQTAARGVPADIPDGSDDDVVARQLREAAEKETDPELRARLWEEYRRYKRGTR